MPSTIYEADFMESFPPALKHDQKIRNLGNLISQELLGVSGDIDKVLIFPRIDKLDADVLDILAYDLNVEWYDYTYPVEIKRNIIKNAIKVQRKMGTKYSLKTALNAIFPDSDVEEWWEYGGEPGHFRVILDITCNTQLAISNIIINTINLYKRKSSRLDELIVQERTIMRAVSDRYINYYHSIPTNRTSTGKKPYRRYAGLQHSIYLDAVTETRNNIYELEQAGTKPERNIVAKSEESNISLESHVSADFFTSVQTNKAKAGSNPYRNTQGYHTENVSNFNTYTDSVLYELDQTGTKPERNIIADTNEAREINKTEVQTFSYTVKMCGSRRL